MSELCYFVSLLMWISHMNLTKKLTKLASKNTLLKVDNRSKLQNKVATQVVKQSVKSAQVLNKTIE